MNQPKLQILVAPGRLVQKDFITDYVNEEGVKVRTEKRHTDIWQIPVLFTHHQDPQWINVSMKQFKKIRNHKQVELIYVTEDAGESETEAETENAS